MTGSANNKPVLLRAVETILSNPQDIRQRALSNLAKHRQQSSPAATLEEIRERASEDIISRYSKYAAMAGGATALVSIVPGIGTVLAATGGAISDAALCMKFQLEMTWELATVYGRDITVQEESSLCYLLAGFGALTEIAKRGGVKLGVAALANLSRPYLRDAAITAVKLIFRRLGIVFARKAFAKAVPFGIGVGISIVANQALTGYVGREVRSFFATSPGMPQTAGNSDQDIIDAEFRELS